MQDSIQTDMITSLYQLWKQQQLCDITLTGCDSPDLGTEIKAHKLILCSASPFFNAMFVGTTGQAMKEGNSDIIHLPGISTAALTVCLEAVYLNGNIPIDENNIEVLIAGSSYLSLSQVRTAACRYLSNQLSLSTVVRTLALAAKFDCDDLFNESMTYCQGHFRELLSCPDCITLRDLPFSLLHQILSSDALDIIDEKSILFAAILWTLGGGCENIISTNMHTAVMETEFELAEQGEGEEEQQNRMKQLPALLCTARMSLTQDDCQHEFTVAAHKLELSEHVIELLGDGVRTAIESGIDLQRQQQREKRRCLSPPLHIHNNNHNYVYNNNNNNNTPIEVTSTSSQQQERNKRVLASLSSGASSSSSIHDLHDNNNTSINYTPHHHTYDTQIITTAAAEMNNTIPQCWFSPRHGTSTQIAAIGGWEEGWRELKTVEIYNPRTDQWHLGPYLPVACSSTCATVCSNRLYLMTGASQLPYRHRSMISFTRQLNGLRSTNPPPLGPRKNAAMVGVANSIILAGGKTAHLGKASESLNVVEMYATATDTWQTVAPMLSKRACLGVAVVDGAVYAVGGQNKSTLNTVERYDPGSDQWLALSSPMSSLQEARKYLAVSSDASRGLVFAVGGMTTTRQRLSSFEAFDPRNGRWWSLPAMSTARSSFGAAVLDGELFAVGGNVDGGADTGGVAHAGVECYSIVGGKWREVASMSTRRSAVSVSAV